jgi:hypothetical protein
MHFFLNRIGYILLVLAGSYPLKSQSYTSFFTENAEWTMKKVYPTVGPGDNTDYWKIYTQSDTLINGQVYRELVLDKMCKWLYALGQVTILHQFQYDEFPIGAIREQDKKVYFYPYELPPEWLYGGFESCLASLSPGQDHLLYDFGALPGDTVYFSNNRFTIFNEVLNPVQNLAVTQVTPSNTFIFPHETGTWTEGIGSSYGLLGSYDSYLHYLVCFKKNNTPLVYNGQCLPCPPPSSSDETTSSTLIKVFPNPVADRLYIQLSEELFPSNMRILDPLGKVVLEQTLSTSTWIELPSTIKTAGWMVVALTDREGRSFLEKVVLTSH